MVELRQITKRFGAFTALDSVSLKLRPGTVHALLGENGAGKSTLMKILMGLITEFRGQIILRKQTFRPKSVREALDRGLAMIHQELTYVPHLSIAENIFLGKEPTRLGGVWIDRRAMHQQTRDLLKRVGLDLDPNELMKDLGVAKQQMVEIAKALSEDAKILILDEPTNDLDIETLELLEEILLGFDGTVLLVSHDRDFMDNVITSLIVLDDEGGVNEYVGGFSDWEARGGSLSAATATSKPKPAKVKLDEKVTSPNKNIEKKQRLSYKDQRELGNIPGKIEKLETRMTELEGEVAAPGFYQSSQDDVQRVLDEVKTVQGQLEVAYLRWDELEAKK